MEPEKKVKKEDKRKLISKNHPYQNHARSKYIRQKRTSKEEQDQLNKSGNRSFDLIRPKSKEDRRLKREINIEAENCQHVVILDWDDTLLPTSDILIRLKSEIVEPEITNLKELDVATTIFLRGIH